jgi:tetratricopeptide (TPR) repeat protein/CHAT domain-containing protein
MIMAQKSLLPGLVRARTGGLPILILILASIWTLSAAAFDRRAVAASLGECAATGGNLQSGSQSAERQGDQPKLELGKAVTVDMAEGQVHYFEVAANAGEFIYVAVDELGVALTSALFDPSGKMLLETHAVGSAEERVSLSFIAASSRLYRIEIRPSDKGPARGRYRITLEEQRRAAPQDDKRIAAQRAFIEGAKLYEQATDESYRLAVGRFTQAQFLYRELGMRIEEGVTLSAMGWVHVLLDEYEKAVGCYDQALATYREVKDRTGEGHALNGLGIAYDDLGEHEKAIHYCEQALAISREVKDRDGEGNAFNNLGLSFQGLRQYERAIDYYHQGLEVYREVKDRVGEGRALSNLGIGYEGLTQYAKAVEYIEQALVVSREVRDRAGVCVELNNLALALCALKEYRKAISCYEQLLDAYREVDYRKGEPTVLLYLGSAWSDLGDQSKALVYEEQALKVARELSDRDLEGRVLCDLGRIYGQLKQYSKAVEYLEQALVASGAVHNQTDLRTELYDLAIIYGWLNQREKAIEYYNQFLEICRETLDREDEAIALDGLAFSYKALQQYEKAIAHYEQAIAKFSELANWRAEGIALIGLGDAYCGLSQFEKAIGSYNCALEICKVYDHADEGNTLDRLGNSYYSLGQYERAAEYGEQALELYQKLTDWAGMARALNNLGNAYRSLSQYAKAIRDYEQALAIPQIAPDRPGRARLLNNLGNCYYSLSSYDKAVSSFKQALQIYRDVDDSVDAGVVLNNMGEAYRSLSQYGKAIDCYEQALLFFPRPDDRANEAATLNNLGNAYKSKGYYVKAIACHRSALAISYKVQDPSVQGAALNNLGEDYKSLGDDKTAIGYYHQALGILREGKDRERKGTVFHNLMLALKALHKTTLAIVDGKQAINAYQDIRTSIRGLAKELQTSFIDSRESTYRELASLLISQGRLAEAEQVLDLLKVEEYSKIVRRDGPVGDAVGLSPAEQEAQKIDSELAAIGKERGDLEAQLIAKTLTAAGTIRLDQIDRELMPEINKRLDHQAKEIAKEYGTTPDNLHRRGIQRVISDLGRGAVALYTLVSKDAGWLILVTADFRKAYSMDVKRLPETVLDLRLALRDARYDPLPAAQKLYRMLMAQPLKRGPTLAADLRTYGAKTLMWSLDGVLRYIPIAVLHDGQHYMVEQYCNVVITTDQWLRDKSDPTQWTALGLGVSVERDGFPALPGAERELKAIIRERGETTGGVLEGLRRLNDQFTQKSMLDELKNGYPVVHVATHFSYDPVNNDDSVLVLGDGNLRLGDLKNFTNIFAKVDLLVLSACDTAALGKDNGRDAEGLAYQAQALGAKAVLASLWPVADVGTEVLMREFYSIRIKEAKLTKAEALREAQLELLNGRNPAPADNVVNRAPAVQPGDANHMNLRPFRANREAPYSHPYYWAPFVLIGNWR